MLRGLIRAVAIAMALVPWAGHAQRASGPGPIVIVGDAIPDALADAVGDAGRGRAIVVDRQVGMCLLCHPGPLPEVKLHGTLAPDLRGAGARWSIGQLRLRVVDASRVNAASIMPAYHRADHLQRVADVYRGRPILTAQQIEDVVAFLATLKE